MRNSPKRPMDGANGFDISALFGKGDGIPFSMARVNSLINHTKATDDVGAFLLPSFTFVLPGTSCGPNQTPNRIIYAPIRAARPRTDIMQTACAPAARNVQPNCIDHVANPHVRCTIVRVGDRRTLGRALHARTRPGPLQAEHAKRKSPCPHALHQSQTGTAARGRGDARRRFGDSSRLTWPAICPLTGAFRLFPAMVGKGKYSPSADIGRRFQARTRRV
jgi:hypothetical protein